MDWDSSAEIRSAMFVLHPCPPMPVVGGHFLGEEGVQRDAQMSSHDTIAFCVDVAARRQIPQENQVRALVQQALTDAYIDLLQTLVRSARDNSSERRYEAMCHYTRSYIRSYFPLSDMDVRFAPLGDVGVRVRSRVCEWLAARHILDLGNMSARSKDHEHKRACQLYDECAAHIVDQTARAASLVLTPALLPPPLASAEVEEAPTAREE